MLRTISTIRVDMQLAPWKYLDLIQVRLWQVEGFGWVDWWQILGILAVAKCLTFVHLDPLHKGPSFSANVVLEACRTQGSCVASDELRYPIPALGGTLSSGSWSYSLARGTTYWQGHIWPTEVINKIIVLLP